jgi:hypothetical protein
MGLKRRRKETNKKSLKKWGHLNDAVADACWAGGIKEKKKVAHDETRTDTRPTRKKAGRSIDRNNVTVIIYVMYVYKSLISNWKQKTKRKEKKSRYNIPIECMQSKFSTSP